LILAVLFFDLTASSCHRRLTAH